VIDQYIWIKRTESESVSNYIISTNIRLTNSMQVNDLSVILLALLRKTKQAAENSLYAFKHIIQH